MARIVNSTSGFNLGCSIKLKGLAIDLQVDYNPNGHFRAVVLRKFHGNCTANVYESGKVVITGARSKTEAKDGALDLAATLGGLGYDAHVQEFKMNNYVGAIDFGCELDLAGIFIANKNISSYEPELFPGLFLKVACSSATIFRGEKVHVTGSESVRQLNEAFLQVQTCISHHLK